MRIGTTTRISTIIAAFAIAAACSKPAPSDTASGTAAPQTPAQALQQMADAAQKMQEQGANAKPVDFEHLIALLPELPGWTRDKPKGEQVSMGVSVSKAEADYEKGESSMRLEITDSSFNQMILAPFSMMLMANFSERTSSGYKKGTKINGQPGFEEWDSEDKDGNVTAVVANRFVVSARGNNLEGIEPLRALVQAVDFAKLGALK